MGCESSQEGDNFCDLLSKDQIVDKNSVGLFANRDPFTDISTCCLAVFNPVPWSTGSPENFSLFDLRQVKLVR